MTDLTSWSIAVLPHIAAATALLIAGIWLARRSQRSVAWFLEHHHVLDLTFRGVLTSLVGYAILLLAVIAALQPLVAVGHKQLTPE